MVDTPKQNNNPSYDDEGSFGLFKGRMGRRPYIIRIVILFLLNIFLVAIFSDAEDYIITILRILVGLPMATYAINCHVKRFHDLGQSGWTVLLLLIPVVNLPIFSSLILASNATEKYDPFPLYKTLVHGLAIISGMSVLIMIAVTFVDIVCRLLRFRFTGAVDIVQIAGAVSIAAALPYTTAVNAHVAIEFVLHKLSHRGRLVMSSIIKLMTIALFVFAAHRSFLYGNDLRDHNQGTMTLQFPMCWMMYMIAVCLSATVLVVLYSLLKPNKELIKL